MIRRFRRFMLSRCLKTRTDTSSTGSYELVAAFRSYAYCAFLVEFAHDSHHAPLSGFDVAHLMQLAAEVSPDAVDNVANILADRDEVTHNYIRDGRLNVWFTVMLRPDQATDEFLAGIRECAGVSSVHVLPSVKMFKLDASFNLGDNDE